jgi:hypothetical protein
MLTMAELNPLTLDDFEPGRPGFAEVVIRARGWTAQQVWDELHGDRPLHWCTVPVGVQWTSDRPFGVGTTRNVTLIPGIVVAERYFHWRETEDVFDNAFAVQRSSAPGLRRFGERYTVRPTADGAEFRWAFYAELALPGGARLTTLPLKAALQVLKRESEKFFSPR